MKKIITTVGTSVFTNITKKGENKTIIDTYKRLEKEPATSWEKQKSRIGSLRCETKNAWLNKSDDSAEIKSILAILGMKKDDDLSKFLYELKEDIHVYLLATDTVLSTLACLLIKDWFEDKPQFSFKIVRKEKNPDGKEIITIEDLIEDKIKMLVIENLRVVSDSSSTSGDSDNNIDDDTINLGFLNLIDKIWNIISSDKQNCILNISGGYKAFIPILTIMGQLYNIPLKYIYEGSDELVEVGTFPLKFDWDLAEQYYSHLNNRLLKDNKYIFDNEKVINQLKFDLLVKKDDVTGFYKVAALGELLKDYVDLNMPHAQSVAGFIAEYKVFEYFCNYPYQEEYSPTKEKRSFKIKHPDVNNNQEEEIDLELRSKENQVVVCEVKSFRRIYGEVKKFKERAKARIAIYKKDGEKIKEYILVIHKGSFDKIENISQNLKEISDEISKEIDFKIFYIERPNKYQEFAGQALKETELYSFSP